MKIVDRVKSAVTKALQPVNNGGGWMSLVSEPFMGAWQKNQEAKREDLTKFFAVFACVSIISEDMGKLWFKLKKDKDGILVNAEDPNFAFLKKPNHFQTWQQFTAYWQVSRLLRGNAYIFKQRNIFGKIEKLFVLNPDRVDVLVSEAGEVFYRVRTDKLAGITDSEIILPASEVIHDRINCLYHPLVGLSPITACALSASQGLAAQNNATALFENMSRPSGILVSPNNVTPEQAEDIKKKWQANYSGGNIGKTAVFGNSMKYEPLSITAEDAQLIELLKMSAEIVCAVFRVPAFKAGIAAIPAGNKVADLNEIYYSDCLQSPIEAMENLLDAEAGVVEAGYSFECDLDSLIRMDGTSQIAFLEKGVKSSIIAPNEARKKLNYAPVPGGDAPLSQQQNFSLEALSKRDALDDPFSKAVESKPASNPDDAEKHLEAAIRLFQKHMGETV